MLKTFEISNYKSLAHLKLELGRINVFVGENGAGKTNILEGLAFVAAMLADKTDNEELMARGVRVARPEITLSAFRGCVVPEAVKASCEFLEHDGSSWPAVLVEVSPESGGSSAWQDKAKPSYPAEAFFAQMVVLAKAQGILSGVEMEGVGRVSSNELTAEFIREIGDTANAGIWSYLAARASRHDMAGIVTPFAIYSPNSLALRGLQTVSHRTPIGIYGEDLDVAFAALPKQLRVDIATRAGCINWFEDVLLDPNDDRKRQGAKPGRSRSRMYFRDRFMAEANAEFSAENANEGILYLMFYLTLFSSPDTPKIFGIDNIETALNPQLCRDLTTHLAELAKQHDKQALITTHNPAILDGLDLADDDQRLFVVERDDDGHTVARRIRTKPANPESAGRQLKLSEMWMRGLLGGIPERF